jgi:hypothetical protein
LVGGESFYDIGGKVLTLRCFFWRAKPFFQRFRSFLQEFKPFLQRVKGMVNEGERRLRRVKQSL